MIIYYTEDFMEVLNDSLQYVRLSKFKLSSLGNISCDDLKNINKNNNVLSGLSSPTVGYYEAEGIINTDSSILSLSIEIPKSDISIEDYTTLMVFSENLLKPMDPPKIAFIISGSMKLDTLSDQAKPTVEFSKLYLEPDRTIINISKFNPQCSLILKQDSDIKFLEGKGLGTIGNLLIDVDDKESRYVSRNSYEAYLQKQRGTDDYKHYYTSFINNYGFKIY